MTHGRSALTTRYGPGRRRSPPRRRARHEPRRPGRRPDRDERRVPRAASAARARRRPSPERHAASTTSASIASASSRSRSEQAHDSRLLPFTRGRERRPSASRGTLPRRRGVRAERRSGGCEAPGDRARAHSRRSNQCVPRSASATLGSVCSALKTWLRGRSRSSTTSRSQSPHLHERLGRKLRLAQGVVLELELGRDLHQLRPVGAGAGAHRPTDWRGGDDLLHRPASRRAAPRRSRPGREDEEPDRVVERVQQPAAVAVEQRAAEVEAARPRAAAGRARTAARARRRPLPAELGGRDG